MMWTLDPTDQLMTVAIRSATRLDGDAIRRLCLLAFSDAENQSVATLAVDLLHDTTQPDTLSWVAEVGHDLVGYIAFSPVATTADPYWQGHILAPLAVHPDHQRQGIGSALVKNGLHRLTELHTEAVLVYGDPLYYGRFGFDVAGAASFVPPYPLQYPFGWQVKRLRPSRTDVPTRPLSCVSALCHPVLW